MNDGNGYTLIQNMAQRNLKKRNETEAKIHGRHSANWSPEKGTVEQQHSKDTWVRFHKTSWT